MKTVRHGKIKKQRSPIILVNIAINCFRKLEREIRQTSKYSAIWRCFWWCIKTKPMRAKFQENKKEWKREFNSLFLALVISHWGRCNIVDGELCINHLGCQLQLRAICIRWFLHLIIPKIISFSLIRFIQLTPKMSKLQCVNTAIAMQMNKLNWKQTDHWMKYLSAVSVMNAPMCLYIIDTAGKILRFVITRKLY